jgi:hypothetical protein
MAAAGANRIWHFIQGQKIIHYNPRVPNDSPLYMRTLGGRDNRPGSMEV